MRFSTGSSLALAAGGRFAEAAEAARRRIALDPLDESAHRQLMQCLVWNGDRAGALRQFRECAAVLDRELGVSPLPETRLLYEQILEEKEPPAPAGRVVATPVVLHRRLPAATAAVPDFVGRSEELSSLDAAAPAADRHHRRGGHREDPSDRPMALSERKAVGSERRHCRAPPRFPIWRSGTLSLRRVGFATNGDAPAVGLGSSSPSARAGQPRVRNAGTFGRPARCGRALSRRGGRRLRPPAPRRRAGDRRCPVARRFVDGDAGLSADPPARPDLPKCCWPCARRSSTLPIRC